MTKLLIIAATMLACLAGTANAETIKPSHGNVKTLMCYQYSPGSWITVYIPSSQVENRSQGRLSFGECGPA